MTSYLKIFKIFKSTQKLWLKEKIGLQTGQNYDHLRDRATRYSIFIQTCIREDKVIYLVNICVDNSFNHAHITLTMHHNYEHTYTYV